MRSLFVRIWISFWAVLLVTFLAALSIDYVIAVKRSQEISGATLKPLAESGGIALAQHGEEGLRHWLHVQLYELPELRILVIDPSGQVLFDHRQAEVDRVLDKRRPGAEFPADVRISVKGHEYRFVFDRTETLEFDFWDILLQPGVLVALVLLVSGLGSAFLAWTLSQPVTKLRDSVTHLSEGRLDVEAKEELTRRRDELGSLARDFNNMVRRLKILVESKEDLLRYVSHQLRSPLSRLRVNATLAKTSTTTLERDQALDRINKEVERVDALLGQILLYSRAGHRSSYDRVPVDLSSLIEEVVDDGQIEGRSFSKTVVMTRSAMATVDANRPLLRSAIENVLRNAIRHAPQNSEIDIALRRIDGQAIVTIADRGPGVEMQEIDQIFDPFVGSGEGSGLGLAIARTVVANHGGSIVAENRPEGGLVVTICFPAPSVPGPPNA
jgi:two-component system sensor histidine kinase CpxA